MKKEVRTLRFFWELITVAIGVFMALFVNNLSESRKEKELVENVLRGVKQEVEQNRTIVNRSLEFHSGFLEKLREGDKSMTLQINAAPIMNSAWEAAKSSEVLHLLDFELSLAISEIYTWHEEYDKLRFLSDQALYFIRFGNVDYKGTMLNRWSTAFEDFLYTEQKLIESYNKLLNMI